MARWRGDYFDPSWSKTESPEGGDAPHPQFPDDSLDSSGPSARRGGSRGGGRAAKGFRSLRRSREEGTTLGSAESWKRTLACFLLDTLSATSDIFATCRLASHEHDPDSGFRSFPEAMSRLADAIHRSLPVGRRKVAEVFGSTVG
jgi:hypothetical protein